jgi:protein phosphatase methylesterase 1
MFLLSFVDSISSGTLKSVESARISIPPQLVANPTNGGYTWRTNLFESEKFWRGWFTDLSKTFLSAKVIKVLILAGTDRLDRELTAAQMQGKYQLVLQPACGHVIMEDV